MAYSTILLIFAAFLLIVGVILLCSGGEEEKEKHQSSPKKNNKTSKAKFDQEYAVNFTNYYLQTGDILTCLKKLAEFYSDNRYMQEKIRLGIDYLEGDYGDYETGLGLICEKEDEAAEKAHNEAILSEIAKRNGLPGR